ncbi:transcriptional regulator [Shinella sp.]|uniref:transcriptional regulator n=1 Tax=Shinella sp. TaxID=1870904 RepID=UPI003F70A312
MTWPRCFRAMRSAFPIIFASTSFFMGRMKEELSLGVHARMACVFFKAMLFFFAMETLSPEAALTKARKIAGGSTALAQKIGISPQAVGQWKVAPPGRVLRIEVATGVSRHLLRPDIFGEVADDFTEPHVDVVTTSTHEAAE